MWKVYTISLCRFSLLTLLLACGPARAQQESTEEELLEEAAKLYNLEKYSEAAAAYERILRSGKHSAGLYFNLGNAHYKMNQLGPSILYYEKALLLDPGDKQIRQNLRFAEQMRIDAIEVLPETFGQRLSTTFLGAFHYDTWAALAVAFSVLLSGFYVVYFVAQESRRKRLFFILGSVSVLLFLICLGAGLAGRAAYLKEQPAILFGDSVRLTSAPNPRSELLFELHEGTKVYLLDELDDWARVRLPNGVTGWLQRNQLVAIKGSAIPSWGS